MINCQELNGNQSLGSYTNAALTDFQRRDVCIQSKLEQGPFCKTASLISEVFNILAKGVEYMKCT